MALTVDSKIEDLIANAQTRAEIDKIVPGMSTHPQINFVKGMPLSKCAALLPNKLTPEVMSQIEEMLKRISGSKGTAAVPEGEKETGVHSTKKSFDFDEIIDRENTNSVKYSTGVILNPFLPAEHIPMWIADMDFACPQPILDAMKERLDKRILGYSMPLDPRYYIAVIDWMKRRHDWDINFDSIVYSSGVVRALNVAVERLTKPGDGVLLNTPAYHPFDDAIEKFGRTTVYCPLMNKNGLYEFDFDDFEHKAKNPRNSLFFFCNPHNPTGRVFTEAELHRIADICFKNNVFVVSDEIHCDIIRVGEKHIPLAKLYPNEKRIITCTAPSKTFNLAGNQLSNIIITDLEIANEWRIKRYCGIANPLSIDACRAAYEECEDWLDALKLYLDDSFKFVDAYLKEHLPKANFFIPEGTYFAWIDLRAFKKTDAELKEIISKAGLFIQFADEFVSDGEGFVRMNLACPRSVIRKAMRILCLSLAGTID